MSSENSDRSQYNFIGGYYKIENDVFNRGNSSDINLKTLHNCFWDALITKITSEVIEQTFGINFDTKYRIRDFVSLLKEKVIKTTNVEWNGTPLMDKEMEENLVWIKEYNILEVANGHDCSVCDPFLLLACELFKVDIIHDYNGVPIKYSNKNSNGKIINFSSNTTHFW